MIFVKQDPATRQWGYEIVVRMGSGGNIDGQRIIDSSFEGFDAPNTIYAFVTSLQKALLERKYKVGRDRETRTYGFQVYELNSRGQPIILTEQYGWQNTEEVNEHVNLLSEACREETKTIFAPPPVQNSKKALNLEQINPKLAPNFRIEEDE